MIPRITFSLGFGLKHYARHQSQKAYKRDETEVKLNIILLFYLLSLTYSNHAKGFY